MKIFSILCLPILLFFATDGFSKKAELRFRTAGYERIQLIINGRLVNRQPAEEIHLLERPGRHQVKIRVFTRRGRLKFEHHDQLHIRPHTTNGFVLESDSYRGSRLLKIQPAARPNRPVLRKPGGTIHSKPHAPLLRDEEFFRIKDAVSLRSSDKARLRVARKELHNRLLYSKDVEEILYLFRFENSRLSFAQWAYSRVIDPENYDEVYKAFRYEASIIQLRNHLRLR